MNILGFFQRLGRALQLPIAVLPVAALLLRLGDDVVDVSDPDARAAAADRARLALDAYRSVLG